MTGTPPQHAPGRGPAARLARLIRGGGQAGGQDGGQHGGQHGGLPGRAETAARALTVVWLALLALWGLAGPEGETPRPALQIAMMLVGAALPVALLWMAAQLARVSHEMRAEAAEMRRALETLRQGADTGAPARILPDMERRIEEIARAASRAESALARRAGLPAPSALPPSALPPSARALSAHPGHDRDPAPGGGPDTGRETGAETGPDTPAAPRHGTEARLEPIAREPIAPEEAAPEEAQAGAAGRITVGEFLRALDFPESAEDRDGIRALRRALAEPALVRFVRAAQDVLTLLSQDGIYMDDLAAAPAPPALWRRFGAGERGAALAPVGGVRDRAALGVCAARMEADAVFRDAVHHFLRQFDRTFADFAANADDAQIAALGETRTARAFMLLGRVTGLFD